MAPDAPGNDSHQPATRRAEVVPADDTEPLAPNRVSGHGVALVCLSCVVGVAAWATLVVVGGVPVAVPLAAAVGMLVCGAVGLRVVRGRRSRERTEVNAATSIMRAHFVDPRRATGRLLVTSVLWTLWPGGQTIPASLAVYRAGLVLASPSQRVRKIPAHTIGCLQVRVSGVDVCVDVYDRSAQAVATLTFVNNVDPQRVTHALRQVSA